MSVARNIIKNPKLVPGGGASELTVSATLKQKSSSIEGIEKVSVTLLFLLFKDYFIWIIFPFLLNNTLLASSPDGDKYDFY